MDSTGLRVSSRPTRARGHASSASSIVRPLPGAAIERILAIAGVESVLDLVDDA